MQQPNSNNQYQSGGAVAWILIAILGIFGGVVAYWYTTPQEIPPFVRDVLPSATKYSRPLYRWRDAQGHLQVTDQPPQGRPYETVQYHGEANVIPPLNPPSHP